jgi:hypothetical protein
MKQNGPETPLAPGPFCITLLAEIQRVVHLRTLIQYLAPDTIVTADMETVFQPTAGELSVP